MPCRAHAREVRVRVRLRGETTTRLAAYNDRKGIPASLLRNGPMSKGTGVVVRRLPIGTLLSNTWSPTLVHLPIGSKLTPRLIRACAKSRRLVRRVFVRMVTGRGTSFASKNSMAWFDRHTYVASGSHHCGGRTSATGKSWNNFSVRKSLYP